MSHHERLNRGSTAARLAAPSLRILPPIRFLVSAVAVLCFARSLAAQTALSVATASDLVSAITAIDSNPSQSYTINFTAPVTLTASSTLPVINTAGTVTIDGHGNTLDGGGIQRGFFVYAGTVTLQNLAINHAVAKGGNGGNGAGGGMGAGGALFMSAGTHVTLTNMSFSQNSAVGGSGGALGIGNAVGGPTGAGGGGGMGGNGGSSAVTAGGGYGGGGGFGLGADGGAGGSASGMGGNGGPGIFLGGASASNGAAAAGSGGSGGANGGGGGGGGAQPANSLTYGGTGGVGGAAGYGGGGGGNGTPSAGGYGGGGGCIGGPGGYGGGGGTYIRDAAGASSMGGFGGGAGYYFGGGSGSSGGGMGAGGAIFNAGGTLTVTGTLSISGGSVAGGSSGGRGLWEGIFMGRADHGDSTQQPTLTFAPLAGQTQRISDTIGDESLIPYGIPFSGTGITVSGAGTVILTAQCWYSSNVAVQSGTLDLEAGNAGANTLTVASGATLTGQGSVNKLVLLSGAQFVQGPAIVSFSTGDVTWNGGATLSAALSSSDATATSLAIAGALAKGEAGQFVIDFKGTGQGGRTYTLATFRSTTFAASDFSAANLPAGLTGTFVVTPTQLQIQLLNTSVAVPVLQSGIAEGTAGTPLSYQIVGTNSPYVYSVVSGTLPPGLTLNTSTGLISGTPTTMGDYTVVVSAGNAGGSAASSLRFEIAIATTNLPVATASDLVAAITRVNGDSSTRYTITFTASIALGPATPLPILAPPQDLKVFGAGFVLDGGGTQRGFYVTSGTVDFISLTIQNMLARGGNGTNGGGGGLGAGGALYIQSPANVTLENVTFGSTANPNRAIGGAGSSIGPTTAPTGFGGGGGMATDGAPGSYLVSGGNGGNGVDGTGGGAGGAGTTGAGATGGPGGGGGGAGILPNSSIGGAGGAGGFGGGGGAGGFGGAGAGGFGAGGGGANGTGGQGAGGFGGGSGDAGNAAGGGGLGAGGAIFVSGGSLNFASGTTVAGNTVTGGTGGVSSNGGSAFGSGVFLVSPANPQLHQAVSLTVVGNATDTISDTISDSSNGAPGGWGLTITTGSGTSGTVALSGANTFSGGVEIQGGILAANNTTGSATGTGPVTVQSGATLAGTGNASGAVSLMNGSFLAPGTGIGSLSVGPVSWAAGAEVLATLSGSSNASSKLVVNGALTKSGTGNYVFNFQSTGATGQTYTLATYSSTTFASSDFSSVGLTPGLTGTFTVGATSVQFTTSGTAAKLPVITSNLAATGMLGIGFNYTITATNTATSYTVGGSLPPGLSLNSTTGAISGTPSQKGTFNLTIGASNAVGSATATLSITITDVTATPVITSSGTAAGTQGVAFNYGIVATNGANAYSVTGSLPAGLSLNPSTGIISGTPTQSGSFTVTIGASNTAGSGTAPLAITIAAPATTTGSSGGGGGGGGGAPSFPFLVILAAWFAFGLTRRSRAGASGTT